MSVLAIIAFCLIHSNVLSQLAALDNNTLIVLLGGTGGYTALSLIWALTHFSCKRRKEPWWELPLWIPAMIFAYGYTFVEGITSDFEKAWYQANEALENRWKGIGYHEQYLLVRHPDGRVAMYAWDSVFQRQQARKLLKQGLTLELIAPAKAAMIDNIYSTRIPVGDVLTTEQAMRLVEVY